MNNRRETALAAAQRLIQQGRLTQAVTAIQTALKGGSTASNSAADAKPERGDHAAAGPFSIPEALRGLVDRAAQPLRARDTPGVHKQPLPPGARFEERMFANAAGSRSYKLYVPGHYDKQTHVPLVVMLHGCTQSPDDFAAGTQMNAIAEEQGFLVAYPAQSQAANPSKCWNWFNREEQRRDQGEPSLIAGIARAVTAEFPIDPDKVYVAGLSAGGAAAAIMGATYPDIFAAIGVHSGLACGAAQDVASAFNAMRTGGPSVVPGAGPIVPTIVFHGDRDTTVSPVNAAQVMVQSAAGNDLTVASRDGVAAGGTRYTCAVHSDRTGRPVLERWTVHGMAHAWSGGSPAGSYTDPRGPDASREMMRFFGAQTKIRN